RPPHLGTAYEKIAADVIARYKRLCGFETHFLMGNDEHSQNVYRSAKEQGLSPIEYGDRWGHEVTTTWLRSALVCRREGALVHPPLAPPRRILRGFHPYHGAAASHRRHRDREADP